MVRTTNRKSSGVRLAGQRGKGFIDLMKQTSVGRNIYKRQQGSGFFSDMGKSLLTSGKTLLKDQGAQIAGNLAQMGAQALINKTMGSGFKVKSVKVVKKRK